MLTTTESLRQRFQLQEAVLKAQSERSLLSFVREVWPVLEPHNAFMSNWHIELVVESLEAVTEGEITRLLINMPPRYMKSLLVSVIWPVWEWLRRPGARWIFVSYSESLALKHSVDRRMVVQSRWYEGRWGAVITLAADQNLKGEFSNTERGTMIATSIGGTLTGKGGNRIVIDDPHNPSQASSDAQREMGLEFFAQTLSTRLDDKMRDAIVVVMQRLHERDLSALCKELGYTEICLPVEAERRTTIVFPRSGRTVDREVGELLWEARDGHTELAELKRVLGSSGFAGQYQQRPAPAGGLIFKREWFRYYDELPELNEFAHSWDMSFKGGTDADYVVGLAAGRRAGEADIYLMERAKGQWPFAETCRQLQLLLQRCPAERILVEDAANGPAIVNALEHVVSGLVAVPPLGGKRARAHAAQPAVEAGNIYLPNPRPYGALRPDRVWVDDFLHQLEVFPQGANDDDVDAFTQLVTNWKPEADTSLVW